MIKILTFNKNKSVKIKSAGTVYGKRVNQIGFPYFCAMVLNLPLPFKSSQNL